MLPCALYHLILFTKNEFKERCIQLKATRAYIIRFLENWGAWISMHG